MANACTHLLLATLVTGTLHNGAAPAAWARIGCVAIFLVVAGGGPFERVGTRAGRAGDVGNGRIPWRSVWRLGRHGQHFRGCARYRMQ